MTATEFLRIDKAIITLLDAVRVAEDAGVLGNIATDPIDESTNEVLANAINDYAEAHGIECDYDVVLEHSTNYLD